MGARPLHYLLTTALPASLGTEWIASFARGLGDDQRLFGIDSAGRRFGLDPGSSGAVADRDRRGRGGCGDPAQRRPGPATMSGSRARSATRFSGSRVLRGGYPELAAEHRARADRSVPAPRTARGSRSGAGRYRACDDRRFRRAPRRSRPHLRDLAASPRSSNWKRCRCRAAAQSVRGDRAGDRAAAGNRRRRLRAAVHGGAGGGGGIRGIGSRLAVPVTRDRPDRGRRRVCGWSMRDGRDDPS